MRKHVEKMSAAAMRKKLAGQRKRQKGKNEGAESSSKGVRWAGDRPGAVVEDTMEIEEEDCLFSETTEKRVLSPTGKGKSPARKRGKEE